MDDNRIITACEFYERLNKLFEFEEESLFNQQTLENLLCKETLPTTTTETTTGTTITTPTTPTTPTPPTRRTSFVTTETVTSLHVLPKLLRSQQYWSRIFDFFKILIVVVVSIIGAISATSREEPDLYMYFAVIVVVLLVILDVCHDKAMDVIEDSESWWNFTGNMFCCDPSTKTIKWYLVCKFFALDLEKRGEEDDAEIYTNQQQEEEEQQQQQEQLDLDWDDQSHSPESPSNNSVLSL
eukprot:m.45986 g.45986  ORF g.45986 m.45986 type:complete len:240 (-) comp10320_c0_seq2:96-815(-)